MIINIDPGPHFSDIPDFVVSWPAHCVVGTAGVALHPRLRVDHLEAVFDKGEYGAAYSGFEGRQDGLGLADWLHSRDVTAVEVTGIATDYCVRATALDAVRAGLRHDGAPGPHGGGGRGLARAHHRRAA